MGTLKNTSSIVYSTDPDYAPPEIPQSKTSSSQDFRIHLDRRKGGKIVTVVKGFIGNVDDLANLGKTIKIQCGVGGSVKNNEILIQGNVRGKVLKILIDKGFLAKLSGG